MSASRKNHRWVSAIKRSFHGAPQTFDNEDYFSQLMMEPHKHIYEKFYILSKKTKQENTQEDQEHTQEDQEQEYTTKNSHNNAGRKNAQKNKNINIYQYERDLFGLKHFERMSERDLKDKYYALIKKYHPDLNDDNHIAHKMTILLNAAYEILRNNMQSKHA
jgi:hypothetical protein